MAAALVLRVCISFVVFSAILDKSWGLGVLCPAACSCLGSMVHCSKKGLTEIPPDLPEWTTILDLSSNQIRHIPAGAFSRLHRLDEVNLNGNEVETINETAFSNLTRLNTLKLAYNRLQEIPAVDASANFTHLILHHNDIVTINTAAMEGMSSLRTLDLTFNEISELNAGAFPFLPNLHQLLLNNNRIQTLVAGALGNLPSLELLKMNKNRISSIPTDFFTGLSKLKHLELSRNKLEMISGLNFQLLVSLVSLKLKRNLITTLQDGAFYGLAKTQILQLDYNNIESVSNSWLFGLSSLQQLSLSHNQVRGVDTNAWSSCKHLNRLDLTYNQLRSISPSMLEDMGALQYLHLNHNQISYIEHGAFLQLSSLTELQMTDNDISWTVEDYTEDGHSVFEGLTGLTRLDLDHNHIKSLAKRAFTGLSQLRQLHLVDNDITSIQEGTFEDLTSLQELLLNSTNLLCDCDLAWFPIYLVEKGFQNSVHGKCSHPKPLGGRSIYDMQAEEFICDDVPKPVIQRDPVSKIALKGTNTTLQCQAVSSNKAPMSITWKTNNNVALPMWRVQNYERVTEDGLTELNSILHFTAVNDSDTGIYQCIVSNTLGSAYSSKAKVTVHVFPTFTKTPEDLTVKAGQSARLECEASGQPAPEIAWQKDGGDDFPAARERRMHVIPHDSVFFIVDVKSEDQGVYSCTAKNDAGIIKANATLNVLETPAFVKPMNEKSALLGDTTVLECMASGSPKPRLTWLKDGAQLMMGARHYTAADAQLLIIVQTSPSDAGIYTCIMSNALGTEQGVSKLTVYGSSTVYAPRDKQTGDKDKGGKRMDHSTTTGIIIIAVVCCVVGTSLVWVIIIYHTRKRAEDYSATPTDETTLPGVESGSYQTGPLSDPMMLRQAYRTFSKQSDLSQRMRQAAIFPSDVEDDDVRQQIPLTQDEQQLAEASDNSLTLLRRGGAHSDSETLPSSRSSLGSEHGARHGPVMHTFQPGHRSLPHIHNSNSNMYCYEVGPHIVGAAPHPQPLPPHMEQPVNLLHYSNYGVTPPGSLPHSSHQGRSDSPQTVVNIPAPVSEHIYDCVAPLESPPSSHPQNDPPSGQLVLQCESELEDYLCHPQQRQFDRSEGPVSSSPKSSVSPPPFLDGMSPPGFTTVLGPCDNTSRAREPSRGASHAIGEDSCSLIACHKSEHQGSCEVPSLGASTPPLVHPATPVTSQPDPCISLNTHSEADDHYRQSPHSSLFNPSSPSSNQLLASIPSPNCSSVPETVSKKTLPHRTDFSPSTLSDFPHQPSPISSPIICT